MKGFLFPFVFLFVLLAALVPVARAELPPLIDREIFFGDPDISGAQISPDGQYISFLKPYNGVRNIWVKERSQPFEQARLLTADDKRPIMVYFWSRDGKYVLYAQDKGGDENYRIYAVDPKATGDPAPPARDLTPLEKVAATIYDVPRSTPNEIIIGLNDRDPSAHDVYRLDLTTGERTLLHKNTENVAGWVTDLKGNLRLGVRQTADGGTEVLKIDGDSLRSIYSVGPFEDVSATEFTPEGDAFYLETNKGDDVDKSELLLFNMKTGKTKLVDKDPLNEVDFGSAIYSEVTNDLLATVYIGDSVRVYPKQKRFGEDYKKLRAAFPRGNLGIASETADENLWLVSVSRDVDPGSMYLFDRQTGKTELLYRSRPNLPIDDLATIKPVQYKARDGMVIHAFLTTPKGVPAKNLPTILFVHGGPWARDYWGYSSVPQFLANRGYAVLQPNFRGSTGYGKKYLNAGNKQWGTGAMQDDLSDAVAWLIKEGIADPGKVAICGGSYGGFATLAGLAFTPDLYAAGFDIVGPSNIVTLLKSFPPYWAPLKKTFAIRVGDMDDPKDLAMLKAQSPLFSAKNIKAPLFVAQGANDPRVKKAESDQIVVALRDLGRPVEYMVAPDEGHGYSGEENRLAMFTAMERFFARHLGGREQTEVREAIQKKLQAITVDVASVTLPSANAAEAVAGGASAGAAGMPKFDGSLIKPGTYKYAVTLEMRGQKIPMTSTRTVARMSAGGAEILRAIDETAGMMAGADTMEFDPGSLLPQRRSMSQMGAVLRLAVVGGEVKGSMKQSGQEMPISARLDSPVLFDGSGTDLPICTLPLAVGYKATLPTFDLMSGGAKPVLLEVQAQEKVTVGTVTYDAWKILMKPQEDDGTSTTAWVAVDTRTMVKSASTLPTAMGGGSVTMELTP